MSKCGIYCIVSKIDGKVYVGKSIDIAARCSYHFRDLKQKKHSNRHLQNAYNLYGRGNFQYKIIELCSNEALKELEGKYIRILNALDENFGYNFKSEDDGISKHSEETILYMSSIKKSKPVYGFTKNGNSYKKWRSISLCAKELNVNPNDVRRTINLRQRFCRGLILNDKDEFRTRENKRKLNHKNFGITLTS